MTSLDLDTKRQTSDLVIGNPVLLTPVVHGPQRLEIGVVEAASLLFGSTEVKRRAGDDVVDVPAEDTIVRPTHARKPLLLDMGSNGLRGPANEDHSSSALALAHQDIPNTSIQIGSELVVRVIGTLCSLPFEHVLTRAFCLLRPTALLAASQAILFISVIAFFTSGSGRLSLRILTSTYTHLLLILVVPYLISGAIALSTFVLQPISILLRLTEGFERLWCLAGLTYLGGSHRAERYT